MRVAIISGGRDYDPTPADLACLDATLELHEVTHVIHGANPAEMACHRHLKELDRVWLWPCATREDRIQDAKNTEMSKMAHARTDSGWEPVRQPLWVLLPGDTANAEGLATHDGFEICRIGKA